MSDLLQIFQMGDQDGDTIVWDDPTEYVVPASNRTRIIDREASRGIHPGPDGWLTWSRYVGHFHVDGIGDIDVIVWTRIRWQDWTPPEMAAQDLDGGEA